MNNARSRDRQTTELAPHGVIDLEAIQRQIARLWRPESSGQIATPGLPTRSSVLNLIIYAENKQMAERAKAVAEHLSATHSCRVVLFSVVDETEEHASTANIYATCLREEGRPNSPCIERIDISMLPSMLDQAPSLAQPLVIPELPTFLWWPGTPPFTNQTFHAMARSAHQTVIDSLSFATISQLAEYGRLREQLPGSCAIADLNWQRLQPWRELTAQYFDIRKVQWALTCVREIEIEAGEQADNALPSQALLFISWLTHCLGWEIVEVRRTRNDRWYIGVHDQQGSHVRVMIRTRPTNAEYAGHLTSLSVNARNSDGQSSSLSLSRSRGSALIRMHAKSGLDTALHHAVHNPLLPEEALLVSVLESTSHDHVFEAALRHAAYAVELSRRT